jgi:hypothetical protein
LGLLGRWVRMYAVRYAVSAGTEATAWLAEGSMTIMGDLAKPERAVLTKAGALTERCLRSTATKAGIAVPARVLTPNQSQCRVAGFHSCEHGDRSDEFNVYGFE